MSKSFNMKNLFAIVVLMLLCGSLASSRTPYYSSYPPRQTSEAQAKENTTVDDIKMDSMQPRPQQQLEPETVYSDILISSAVPAVTVSNGLRRNMCDEVNQYYFTSCSSIGGSGGSHFSNNAEADGPSHNGGTLSGIQAWKNEYTLRGLRLFFDKAEFTHGKTDGEESAMFFIGKGEMITEAVIYGGYIEVNGKNVGRCKGFKLTTDQGRTFDFKTNKPGEEFGIDVGSGVLMGVFGKSGYDIDSLGFAFLRPVRSAVMKNVKYPAISTTLIASKPIRIDTIVYDNSKGTDTQTYQLNFQESVMERSSWSATTALEFSITQQFKVEASFPIGSASSTTTLSLKESVSTTQGRENIKSFTKSFDFPIHAAAGKQITATVTIYEGAISIPYEGEIEYVLNSGKKFSYNVSGIYSGVTAGMSVVSTASAKVFI